MKTTREIQDILSRCNKIDSHIHTHLCDGSTDMTVENIVACAKARGIDGVILTPHFHKQVTDGETTLYSDTNEEILWMLREEIEHYERLDGSVKILLSTEADILSFDGEISLKPSFKTEEVLDFVTPTLNYHPCLPLEFVKLTYGKEIDKLYESGAYEQAAMELGGVSNVLSLMYEAQANAIIRCPYTSMLGHLFMAHSFHPCLNNAFGAKREHLDLMKDNVSRLISVCKEANAMVDITGVHLQKSQSVEDKIKNNDFLVDFQRYVIQECERMCVATYYGSDAHSLAAIGGSAEYYRKLYENQID